MEALLNAPWADWITLALAIIGAVMLAANTITAATPTQADDQWLGKITPYVNGALRALNLIAGNIGKNRNADDPATPK